MGVLLAQLPLPIEEEEAEILLAVTHPQVSTAHLLQLLILVVVTVAAEEETAETGVMAEVAEDTIGIEARRQFKHDYDYRVSCELSRSVKLFDTSPFSIISRNNTLHTTPITIEISARYRQRPYHVIDRIFLSQQQHFHITYTL